MSNISARIIADSINPHGIRLVSAVWRYPRYIHSEIMTHRVFSRNAASSRAIPLKKMIFDVRDNPACPEYWGKNQKGMQASEELTSDYRRLALDVWLAARAEAANYAEVLDQLGAHKQIANRLLEPWAHMTTLVTATECDNFFALRAHKDAQPEFQVLAYRMLDQYLNKSTPKPLEFGEWHMPFSNHMEGIPDIQTRLKVATARAARVSYVTFDGNASVDDDMRLHDQLLAAGHMSPFEHCAMAMDWDYQDGIYSNFHPSWRQYRKTIPNECRSKVDLHAILASKPDWVSL